MSTINLLPRDYVKVRSQRRATVICLILFGVVMPGVIVAGVLSDRSTQQAVELRDAVNASYEDAAKLIGQMQQLQAQKGKLLLKAGLTAALMERVPRSALLAVIRKAMPEHTALTEVELEVKRPPRASTPAEGSGSSNRSKFAAVAEARMSERRLPVVQMTISGLAGTDVVEIVVAEPGNVQLHPPLCKAFATPTSGLVPTSVTHTGFYTDLDGQAVEVIWEV